MCVCDTQVEAGQRISTEYVTAVVSSGTGHSGILTRVLTITVDSAVVIGWAGDCSMLTGMATSAVYCSPSNIGSLASSITTTLQSAFTILTWASDA